MNSQGEANVYLSRFLHWEDLGGSGGDGADYEYAEETCNPLMCKLRELSMRAELEAA